MRSIILAAVALACWPLLSWADDSIDVAEGLTIRLIADDDAVPDCTSITVDSSDNIIAAGPGYIRMLLDSNGNGTIDDSILLTDHPRHGAQGLCVDGGSLYYVANNGIWRMDDSDGNGIVDTEPSMVLAAKTGGEHDAHALRKGPDGFWYLITGNKAEEMFALQNVESTSVPKPRAGAIWRISPDWSQREVWAHGFRNAYDFDFAPDHSIITFDSDGERDVSLPWYRPTRVFRVRRGDDAGWMTRSWKRPNLDPQMPEVMAELGRGSPTGVLRSRPGSVTKHFGHGVFVLDWTFGRVIFVRDSGGWDTVAEPRGTAGFAVTDIDSLSDGRVVISVGGRRSRGGIYLIDAKGTPANRGVEKPIWAAPHTPAESDPAESDPAESDPAESEATGRWIVRLRQQPARQIDHAAAERAVNTLEQSGAGREPLIAACVLLIESVGGLGAGDPKDPRGEFQAAAVFDSCRSILRPRLQPALRRRATDALIDRVNETASDTELTNELIRALAVIEPDSQQAFERILGELRRVTSPTDKLHRLIALARLPVKRSDAMTDQTASAMLQIPRMIAASQAKVDRNWTPRLGELFVALEHRDSLLPSRLVATPDFGRPADLVWTVRMDPENLERARQRLLAGDHEALMNPKIARFIARGDDAVPPAVIRRWLSNAQTRPAGWLAIASHARITDVELLREAALSVDVEAQEAAAAALARLGEPAPARVSDSKRIQDWLARADTITAIKADAMSGKRWFEQRQCANCHNGANALGPSLEGISKRFGSRDIFRSTVDPSHTISDRYHAKQVVTVDGDIVNGMPIYESVDGVTLMTADTKMKRINAEDIDQIQDSVVSLMPEGLLDGMRDDEVAELIAYLRSL